VRRGPPRQDGFARRGKRLSLSTARRTKPSIPLIGFHGIPFQDELTMVTNLDDTGSATSGGLASRPQQ
jgi:hypothetical protein